jgi:hypothetical protein
MLLDGLTAVTGLPDGQAWAVGTESASFPPGYPS